MTEIEFEVPVIDVFTMSDAVSVCPPRVFSVAENMPVPFASVELAGSTAWPSVLAKCTVPE